jgi:hypothetical protein
LLRSARCYSAETALGWLNWILALTRSSQSRCLFASRKLNAESLA